MGPFDRAADQLEKAYENEELTSEEYEAEMQGLREEQREYASERAQEAYDDVMGVF